MPSITDQFLDLYKQLEHAGRTVFFPQSSENENIIGRLINLPQFARHKEDLNYCRVVRNFLTHNPRVGGAYPITPSIQMVHLLEQLLAAVENPPKALDFAIKRKFMLTVRPTDFAIDTMHRMREKAYTHVPVVDRGKLLGVFSDSVVTSYICGTGRLSLLPEAEISLFRQYYRLDAPENQVFAFVPETTPLDVVEAIFEDNYKRRLLISVVYITKRGRANESILGMLTPWDVLLGD